METVPINGERLLDEVEAILRKYTVHQTEHEYAALALYAAFTHGIKHFDFAPRLLLTSAEKRSGKTTTLTVMSNLVRGKLVTANATVAAIFRSLQDPDNPRTLCFDEADTIFGTKMKAEQNEELRGLLNAGFQRGAPMLRVVGQNHTVDEFESFAPAIMCAIGRLPDTITDRAINIRCRRRRSDETVSDYRIRRDSLGLQVLYGRLESWVEELGERLQEQPENNPLHDRAADVWEPLLVVGEAAGERWARKGREAACYFTRLAADDESEQSVGVELLADIHDVLSLVQSNTVGTAQLLSLLKGKEESRWMIDDLSARKLAELLKPYGITSVKLPGGKQRGYKVERFQDAFARYLPTYMSNPSNVSHSLENTGENRGGMICSESVQCVPTSVNTPVLSDPPLKNLARGGNGTL